MTAAKQQFKLIRCLIALGIGLTAAGIGLWFIALNEARTGTPAGEFAASVYGGASGALQLTGSFLLGALAAEKIGCWLRSKIAASVSCPEASEEGMA